MARRALMTLVDNANVRADIDAARVLSVSASDLGSDANRALRGLLGLSMAWLRRVLAVSDANPTSLPGVVS